MIVTTVRKWMVGAAVCAVASQHGASELESPGGGPEVSPHPRGFSLTVQTCF